MKKTIICYGYGYLIFYRDSMNLMRKLVLGLTFLVFGFFAGIKYFSEWEIVYALFNGCGAGGIDVSQSQCEALQSFYNSVNWPVAIWSAWFQNDVVCSWDWISCDTSSPKKKITWFSLVWTSVFSLSWVVPWSFYTGLDSLKTLTITYPLSSLTSNTRKLIFSSSGLALLTGLTSITLWDCGNCVSAPVRKIEFSPFSQFSDLTTLTGLKTLSLKNLNLSGDTSVFQNWSHVSGLLNLSLTNVLWFSWSLNDFSGTNLFPNLATLFITCPDNMQIGWTLSGITNLFNLATVTINGCPLITGWIPDEIAQLQKLTTFRLWNLTWLAWWISSQFGTISSLQNLSILNTELQDNTTKLCWFTGLVTFSFSDALLTWSLPVCLCDNVGMTSFSLSQPVATPTTWRVVWPIPSCIGTDMLKLTSFTLANLNLSGTELPSNFGNLTGLTYLGIFQGSANPQNAPQQWWLVAPNTLWRAYWLTGIIPTSFSSLTKLQSLILPMNSFVWSIPDIFWPMKALKTLNLGHNLDLFASLPPSLTNHTGLTALNLIATSLTWSLDGLSGMKALVYLFIGRNAFFWPTPLSYFNSVFPLRSSNYFSLLDNLLYGKVPLSVASPSVFWYRILENNYCLDFSEILFSSWSINMLDNYPAGTWRRQQHCADIDISVTQTPTNPKQLDVVTYTISYSNVWPNPVSWWNLNFTRPAWLTGIIASRGFAVVWSDIKFSWSALSGMYSSWWSTGSIYNFSTGGVRYFSTTGQNWVIVLTGIMKDSGFSFSQISRIDHITGSTLSGNEINYTNNVFSLAVNVAQPIMDALSPSQCTYVLTSSDLRWYYNGPAVSWFSWQVSSSSGVNFDANIVAWGNGTTFAPGATLYNGSQSFSPFVSSLSSGNLYYWRIRPYVTWNGETYTGDWVTDVCFGVGWPPWFHVANDNCDPRVSKTISAVATGYTSTGLLYDIPAGVWNTWFFYKIILNAADCSWFPTDFLSYTPSSNITFWSWDNGKYVCFYARDEIGDQGYALSNSICGIDSTLPSCTFAFDSTSGSFYQTGWVTYVNTWFVDLSWTGSELLSGLEFSLWAFTNLFESIVPAADAWIYEDFFLGSTDQTYNVAMQCQDQVWFTGSATGNFFLDMTAPSLPVVSCSTTFFTTDFSFGWSSSLDGGVWFQSYDRKINRLSDGLLFLSDTVSTISQNIVITSLWNLTGYSFAVRGCDFLWNCSAYSQCDFSVAYELCGDGLIVGSETCDDSNTDDGDGCSSTCSLESTSTWNSGWWGGGWGGWGGGGIVLIKDECLWWDFSPSYYDKKCDSPQNMALSSAPIADYLDFCSYSDANYSAIDFSDIVTNRHRESINLLLDLCIVRWIPQKNIFLPAKATTRWEFIKVVVKLLGAGSFEPQEFDKNSSYVDAYGHWSATYFEEARKLWLLVDLEQKTKKWVAIYPEAFIKQSEARKILDKAFRLMGASQSDLAILDSVFSKNSPQTQVSRDFFAGLVVKVFGLTTDENIFFSYLEQVMDKNVQATLRTLNIYGAIEKRNPSLTELTALIKNFQEKPLYWYKKMNLNRSLLLQKLNDLKVKK